jgi:hypothetical protein
MKAVAAQTNGNTEGSCYPKQANMKASSAQNKRNIKAVAGPNNQLDIEGSCCPNQRNMTSFACPNNERLRQLLPKQTEY